MLHAHSVISQTLMTSLNNALRTSTQTHPLTFWIQVRTGHLATAFLVRGSTDFRRSKPAEWSRQWHCPTKDSRITSTFHKGSELNTCPLTFYMPVFKHTFYFSLSLQAVVPLRHRQRGVTAIRTNIKELNMTARLSTFPSRIYFVLSIQVSKTL